jgi:glycosyltransferase involved in cell wall biosynthesis
MRILAFPRDDGTPYQRLLYGAMRRRGAHVTYLGELTPSQTLNLLLLPLELAIRRAQGASLVHLHWAFGFGIPGSSRLPVLRAVAQGWFSVWLWTVRALKMPLVWTAHNVLPHEAVFADDRSARRALAGASDLVITHSEAALEGLTAIGAVPRRSVIMPHGPLKPALPAASLRTPGTGDGPRRFLFFGAVRRYKGVEELLAAFMSLPADVPAHLSVAGQCDDAGLRRRLETLARDDAQRVALRLERVGEEDITPLLAACDVVVLPYRACTTSGSAILALAHGRPLVLPDLAGLAALPRRAIVSYDGTVQALAAALSGLARADTSVLAGMSAAALAWTPAMTWEEIASRTMDEMSSLLSCHRTRPRASSHRLNGRPLRGHWRSVVNRPLRAFPGCDWLAGYVE